MIRHQRIITFLFGMTVVLVPSITSFISPQTQLLVAYKKNLHDETAIINQNILFMSKDDDDDDDEPLLPEIFTGGFFDKEDESAIEFASKIRSIKDLGWTEPAKRKGSARPRHRAWGGQDEVAVQDKPNYDESMEKCVEKWLTQEVLESKIKCSGPVSDTIFVAFAGGAAFAERERVEACLAEWRGGPNGKTFNEAAFFSSVKKGRIELALGWALFVLIISVAAGNIVVPNNPLNMALVDWVDSTFTFLKANGFD